MQLDPITQIVFTLGQSEVVAWPVEIYASAAT